MCSQMTHAHSRVFSLFFRAFYKHFYRFSPGKEQQGCFHGNAEESDWQPAVSVLLLPSPQNELPLHCSKYWAFPEPSGGASGDLPELARLRRRVRHGSPVAGIPQINPTRQLSLFKHQREKLQAITSFTLWLSFSCVLPNEALNSCAPNNSVMWAQ